MDFLLYILLRCRFCGVYFKGGAIVLEKGVLVRRKSSIDPKSIICAEFVATPISRLFRIKHARLKTLSGEFTFFLPLHRTQRQKEPFSQTAPAARKYAHMLRPTALSIICGAFVDTRALGGVLTFAYALRRIGRFFGQEYPDSVLSFIDSTAGELSKLLQYLHLAVPRFTAAAAVFTAAAWLMAFAARLIKFARFRLYVGGDGISTSHGIITLYERFIPRGAPCVFSLCDAFSTLVTGAAPIYLENELLFPPIKRRRLRSLAKVLGVTLPQKPPIRPPLRAALGYAAAPLGWGSAFAVAAILSGTAQFFWQIDAELLCALLWCAAVWCGWLALAYALYSRRAVFSVENGAAIISSRRHARLYTSFFCLRTPECRCIMQSVFQRRGGLCDFALYLPTRRKIRFRLGQKRALQKSVIP